ncbi:MAG: transposase [Lewinellaceae bacterium]|nr:transposase [Lewinellaceae bacterium]
MSDLQQRGVEDLLIVSVDGLKGFEEAIRAIFPKAEVQGCICIRSDTLQVCFRQRPRTFAKDLKPVYTAVDEARPAKDG